jgi:hypothetical protein
MVIIIAFFLAFAEFLGRLPRKGLLGWKRGGAHFPLAAPNLRNFQQFLGETGRTKDY